MKKVGKTLTALQFLFIGILFVLGPIITLHNAWLLLLQLMSLLIGIWAILVVGISNVSIFPIPRQGLELRMTGPYLFIRHPMYLAVILFTAPITIQHPTLPKGCFLALLVIDLMLKIHIEEKLLIKEIPNYKAYMQTTWRIIPFIF